MVLGFIKCLGAGDRATFDIGLTRSVERRGSVRIGLALGVLHSIGRRLMMKQPLNGLWGGGAALRAGSRVPDLSLELRDLKVARAATRSAAPAEHGGTRHGDEEAYISAPHTR
jgi:hypothetical protein